MRRFMLDGAQMVEFTYQGQLVQARVYGSELTTTYAETNPTILGWKYWALNAQGEVIGCS